MKTSIEFVNHASVIIRGGDIAILSDPWYQGDAFHKGWNLLHETSDAETTRILDSITHLWLSHEHPDHFSILFFRKFKDKLIERGITILFQETKDQRVVDFLRGQSLPVVELKFNQATPLSDTFAVTCIKDGFYDSGLLIEHDGEKVLNLNDCEVTTLTRVKEVMAITGTIDVLLTQFSYAAWKGGKDNTTWRQEAAEEKLKTMTLQIEHFAPKAVVPFASFVYFSNNENFYLNDAINTPETVVNRFRDSKANLVLMKPGDVLGGENESVSVNDALAFWNAHYNGVADKPLNVYNPVPLEEIRANFAKYCARIKARNSFGLIKLVRTLSPIKAFKPVTVRLSDLEVTLRFDYVTGEINEVKETPMLIMKSESLNFLFNNSFGFDTLTVNGCFEEGQKGGFITATKTLAIENLNNLGINVTLGTLFNVSVIKLFLTRLYRVARKLDA